MTDRTEWEHQTVKPAIGRMKNRRRQLIATDKEIDQTRNLMKEINENPMIKHPLNEALNFVETISKQEKTTEQTEPNQELTFPLFYLI